MNYSTNKAHCLIHQLRSGKTAIKKRLYKKTENAVPITGNILLT